MHPAPRLAGFRAKIFAKKHRLRGSERQDQISPTDAKYGLRGGSDFWPNSRCAAQDLPLPKRSSYREASWSVPAHLPCDEASNRFLSHIIRPRIPCGSSFPRLLVGVGRSRSPDGSTPRPHHFHPTFRGPCQVPRRQARIGGRFRLNGETLRPLLGIAQAPATRCRDSIGPSDIQEVLKRQRPEVWIGRNIHFVVPAQNLVTDRW